MFLHEIKSPVGSRKRKKLLGRGRGSGHGKTSCKGFKGQNARSGRGILNSLEGGQMPLIKRLPKVGFNSKDPTLYQVVNVESLNRFEKGTVINAEKLKKQGLINSLNRPYKILGDGEVKKALVVQAQAVSKTAEEKIVKAGGKVEILTASVAPEVEAAKK